MQAFFLAVLVKAVQNEEIRKFLFELADRMAAFLLPKLAALFPMFAASVAKTLFDRIPGLPNITDLGQLAGEIHDAANHAIPDIDIPILSDVVKDFTGFDFTDWLKGR